jgi:perosamine synthetase
MPPLPTKRLPYGRQLVEPDDIEAVVKVLHSDWLTTGPSVDAFENALAQYVGAQHGVAVSSGTAALHAAMYALGLGPGDEVIVPPMTFAATANAAVFVGATPVFADVDAGTLLIDPNAVSRKITTRTKAIMAVDYAGQPCDYEALRPIAEEHGIALLADGCHAIGGTADGRRVGSIADMTAFSFHPVKHITTGEGGMVTTNDDAFARRMRTFRNHGINSDHRQRSEQGSWFYEMVDLGFNYRITDFQCALGLSQLKKLDAWVARRQEIARQYDAAFAGAPVSGLKKREGVSHAYHLYVIKVPGDRQAVFTRLREANIGANVHYIPVHLHPFYRQRFGYGPGLCPVAEAAYEQILSLPMYPAMTDEDVDYVAACVLEAVGAN